MYVFETPGHAGRDSSHADYYASGSEAELKTYTTGLCAAILGAISMEKVSIGEADDFITRLVSPGQLWLPARIGSGDINMASIFQQVLVSYEDYFNRRMEICLTAAAQGSMSSTQLAQESAAIAAFHEMEGVRYVDRNAYDSTMTIDGLVPNVMDTGDLNEYIEDPRKLQNTARIATVLGATCFVRKYDCSEPVSFNTPPIVQDAEPYVVLGMFDDAGFQPKASLAADGVNIRYES